MREQEQILGPASKDPFEGMRLEGDTKAAAILRWFDSMSEGYRQRILHPGRIDLKRLRTEREYGLKAFFGYWAYERQGAARGFRVAAVKAVSLASRQGDLTGISRAYGEVYHGKKNGRANPAFASAIAQVDIPAVVEQVASLDLVGAFHALTLPGIGHKIRAFFIRDLATITGVAKRIPPSLGDHLYCQPIDVWVRATEQALPGPAIAAPKDLLASTYALNQEDLRAARRLIALALSADVSPLKVNQGIWHFAANFVADAGRLRQLIAAADVQLLADEVSLLEGFRP